ncbi:MAG: 2-oxo acid dehydrogenase subunit E2 [Acidobacteriota bacterium]|nr:2-oxo acid dehydrogenase subunit E2 [Acidobacteriota bacterium]
MAISVVMPALELTQETGKLLAWRKKEGEEVTKGEPLLEVETDKAAVEIEAPADGILAGVKAGEGDVIPVGQTIAWIVKPGEEPPKEAAPAGSSRGTTTEAARPAENMATASPAAGAGAAAARISPKARRLAKEHGVDIARLQGSGPGGEILASDVLAAAEGKAPAAAPAAAPKAAAGTLEPLTSIGRLMAERMTQSWTSVPHFFVTREVDAGPLNAAREKRLAVAEQSGGARPTHTDLLVALVARTLRKHPRLNATWTAEGVRLNPDVNIGIAIAVNDGVIAAVIPNADKATIAEIARQRRELADRAKSGHSRPADITGATFTISNLGMYGVDAFTAIITPPQAAILAVSSIVDRVVPVDGAPGIRPIMSMTLSCDHRVFDGARAALFLSDLAEAIARPEETLG